MIDPILKAALFAALAFVMFALGLSLTFKDFARVRHYPKAVLVALALQLLILPAACFGIALGFQLAPALAIGLMMLSAAPGGISANLFSHLFGGNVALNITLTAITTVVAIGSLPLISNFAIATFAGTEQFVPLQFRKILEVVALVLVPVSLGMIVHRRFPAFARAMEKPGKWVASLVLVALCAVAVGSEYKLILEHFSAIAGAVFLFNLISLAGGYGISRWLGLEPGFATAISFEVGIHNAALVMFIAATVLGSLPMAVPAAVYGVFMYATAAVFGWLFLKRRPTEAVAAGELG